MSAHPWIPANDDYRPFPVPRTWTVIARERGGTWFRVGTLRLSRDEAQQAWAMGRLEYQETTQDGELVARVRAAR